MSVVLDIALNPVCLVDRIPMKAAKTKSGLSFYRCCRCRASTLYRGPRSVVPPNNQRGRPPLEVDRERASELIQHHPMVEAASMLGVSRNLLYYRIGKTEGEIGITARPFRMRITRSTYKRRDDLSLFWPYMKANDPRYEGVIRDVNEAVPRTIADETRADICQEIVVSVLVGEITREQIKSAVQLHMRRHYKLFPTKGYQTVSLDAPIRSSGHDGQERLLIDLIDSETYQEKINISRYGASLADCSTANDLAQRLADGWEADRLIRDRKSFSTFRKGCGERPSDPYYKRLRHHKIHNGKVRLFEFQKETFGGAWTVETALPEEIEKIP